MKYSCPGHSQKGLTLIEIMIAMLLGIFLIGGVVQIFLGSKQTYRMQENLSAIQENGRFAMDFMARDIRMAGVIGCGSQGVLNSTLTMPVAPASYFVNFVRVIEGFEATSAPGVGPATWVPTIPVTAVAAVVPPLSTVSPLGGSDIITIRRAADQGFTVAAHLPSSAPLTLNAVEATPANLQNAGFLTAANANNCMIAVVTNCTSVAVFQVSGIAGNVLAHNTGGACAPGNSDADLGRTYLGGQVMPINTISYFIATNPGGQPSLYRRIDTNAVVELVEGIEQMQISYGMDTDADRTANYYAPVNPLWLDTDWANVVSIRISLLAVSLENVAAQRLPYDYNGVQGIIPPDIYIGIPPVQVQDRRIRRVFTSTIALRNRLR